MFWVTARTQTPGLLVCSTASAIEPLARPPGTATVVELPEAIVCLPLVLKIDGPSTIRPIPPAAYTPSPPVPTTPTPSVVSPQMPVPCVLRPTTPFDDVSWLATPWIPVFASDGGTAPPPLYPSIAELPAVFWARIAGFVAEPLDA